MAAEPTLPPLLPSDDLPSRTRKRSSDHVLEHCSSSDPPLFSSDDHLASNAEDYVRQTRRKRQYRGTWWGAKVRAPLAPREPTQRRREFRRTADSGVWLDSEGTQGSDEEVFDDVTERDAGRGAEEQDLRGVPHVPRSLDWKASKCSTAPMEDTPGSRAEGIIQQCLEEGNERVDLSGLQLTDLSDSSLSSLSSLTRHPPIDHIPPSQETYGPLTPSLALFLSRNSLETVPPSILNLENLTVLSLRNNKLRELPPGIGRLTRLTELNIGGNRLQWLPWEILSIMGPGTRLTRFSLHPNPFVENGRGVMPKDTRNQPRPAETRTALETPRSQTHALLVERGPLFLGASPITYFDVDGSPLHTHTHTRPPRSSPPNHVPSLIELSLRACASSPHLAYLATLFASDDAPPTLHRLLERARATQQAGGQLCSVCGAPFFVTRTEWLEWWDLASLRFTWESKSSPKAPSPSQAQVEKERDRVHEVPVRRRGCSWACVPG